MSKENSSNKRQFEPQHQEHQPGVESQMKPQPKSEKQAYIGSGKLGDKVALITGGDSGIGRAVAILFAQEGADISIVYYNEHNDAAETKAKVEEEGRRCLTISGDISQEEFCQEAVNRTIGYFKSLDILVNNAAVQYPQNNITDISSAQLYKTFSTNIFSMFYITRAALGHLKEGGSIINSSSVTAYRGSKHLIDYSSTKGAIVSFTRSLALNLAKNGIRVNGVAPGPIWTPLIPSSFPPGHVAEFGADTPMQRAGQPEEVAPCYLFLASNQDSSYMTGQILHPNGGEIING
jgi:NAD(P)-dependent dehydrogenase (short-subunit alcohol dehydrogenase family)